MEGRSVARFKRKYHRSMGEMISSFAYFVATIYLLIKASELGDTLRGYGLLLCALLCLGGTFRFQIHNICARLKEFRKWRTDQSVWLAMVAYFFRCHMTLWSLGSVWNSDLNRKSCPRAWFFRHLARNVLTSLKEKDRVRSLNPEDEALKCRLKLVLKRSHKT